MTQGHRHFWERPSIVQAILGFIFFPVIFTFLLSFPLYVIFGIHFTLLLTLLFILFAVVYLGIAAYRPQFPLQVREEIVAKPNKRAFITVGETHRNDDNKPYLSNIVPLRVDLHTYILGKPNRNVLITGTSGQGKSKLSRYLLGVFDYQKVIFSFKANDEYLKMGYKTADVSRMLPNPFSNPEAFVNAFLVAFPVTAVGIQASLVPTNLDKLAKKSSSWKEFKANTDKALHSSKDVNSRSAVAFIQANTERLIYNVGEFSIGKDDIVLDFSSLNDDAKNFYDELILRQVYSEMEKQRMKDILICVDEAHRLTGSEFSKYHTIIVEMSREIRDKGMLWTVTQNYTDIPDYIRNQFATQFMFKTISQSDTSALRSVDPFLSWTASSLPNHYFIDAQFPNMHSFIPLYYYNPKGEETAEVESINVKEVETVNFSEAKLIKERPTATHFRALEAIYNNPHSNRAKLAAYLRTKGGITSDATIYGAKGRPGILDGVVSLGMADYKNKTFELTDKGKRWVDLDYMTGKSITEGGELHKQIMKSIIKKLHEEGTFVAVPTEKNAPDLIAYPVSKSSSKKYLWDDSKRRAYEIQTTARKDSIIPNMERDRRLGLPITWVTYDKEILEEIRKLTNNEDEYLLIRLDK